MFRLTRRERLLVLGILAALLVGTSVKLLRERQVAPDAASSVIHAER